MPVVAVEDITVVAVVSLDPLTVQVEVVHLFMDTHKLLQDLLSMEH